MKTLVTGATGMIGRELYLQLLARGRVPVVTSRLGGALPSGQQTIPVDLENQPLPAACLRDVTTVYHLAGVAHQQADAERYQRLNVEASVTLAKSAARAGVEHFVFVSSVKAMGPREEARTPRGERDMAPATDPYGRSKLAAEEALQAVARETGMRLLIVRPALVYGRQPQGNLRWMLRAARLGLPRPPALGGRSMIGVQDLARLLCQLPGELAAAGRFRNCVIATDGEVYSSQRIYDGLRVALGRGPRGGEGSEWFWRALANALDRLQRQPPGCSYHKLFDWECYDNRQLLSLSQWRPTQTLESVASEWRQ